ncbi:MAG: hypothetical protein WAU42_00800, partial [Solirubrobacteraceae bacterium]
MAIGTATRDLQPQPCYVDTLQAFKQQMSDDLDPQPSLVEAVELKTQSSLALRPTLEDLAVKDFRAKNLLLAGGTEIYMEPQFSLGTKVGELVLQSGALSETGLAQQHQTANVLQRSERSCLRVCRLTIGVLWIGQEAQFIKPQWLRVRKPEAWSEISHSPPRPLRQTVGPIDPPESVAVA